MDAARQNRWGHRDATAILVAYRHGMRASELVALRWDDIDFTTGRLHVRRAKGGETAVHQTSATRWRVLYLYHQIRLTHALEGATIGCMAIEVSGEILRLLSILSDRSDGATQYELAVLEGVSASLIYKAVMLDLVYAQRQSDEEAATFRYYLREAGRALLTPDQRGSPRRD